MPWKRYHRERKLPRLQGWDYRIPAWYFVTIITRERRHFMGQIRNGIMGLSEIGCIAWQNWTDIPSHHDHVKLDKFIIMPNHIHGMIGIMEWPAGDYQFEFGTRDLASRQEGDPGSRQESDYRSCQEFGPLKSGSLSAIIHSYKASVTRWARKHNDYEFAWQSRYHDHIVRNDKEKRRIQRYIYENTSAWDEDVFLINRRLVRTRPVASQPRYFNF